MNTNQISIRSVLYGNAIFSAASGLLFALASKTVANFLGVGDSSLIVLLLGVGLLGYAGLLYFHASRPEISPQFVLFAIIADGVWVLLSILLLVGGWIPFSTPGKWAVGIIAMIVDLFGMLQFLAWRKMR